MADIECPSCGAQLRNAQAGPDGHLRCLNCGKRFALGPAEASAAGTPAAAVSAAPAASAQGTTETSAPAAPARKPAAGSYGLVVVLGFVFLLAAILMGIGFGFGTVSMLTRMGRYGTGFSEFIMMAALTAGMPCLGLSGLYLLRRLAPIDAAAVQLAWRRGALAEGMPQTPGSSLPYILPMTAGGGLLCILPILMSAEHTRYGGGIPMEVALTAIPAGVLLALLGLALGEVRRFLWRMAYTADALARRMQATHKRFSVQPPGGYGAGGLIMFGAAGMAVLTMLAILSNMSRYADRKDVSFWLAMVLLYPGGLCSLGLLTRAAGRTLGAWYRALHAVEPAPRRFGGLSGPSQAFSYLFLWFAVGWACLLPLTVLYLATRWSSRLRIDDDFVLGMSMTLTASLVAVWLATLFAGLHRCRALVEERLDARGAAQADSAAGASPARWLKWALLALSGVIVVFLLPNLRGSEWFMLLLVVSGLAYAAVWLGFLADEARMLACSAELLAQADPALPPAPAEVSNLPPVPPAPGMPPYA